MKNISILGSTGSVGKQALEIVKNNNKFQIDYLYADSNYKLLYEQILIHTPKYACINNIESYNKLLKLDTKDTNIVCGVEDCIEFISSRNVDLALNAIVGISGLKPTLAILESKTKLLALSNKESLVMAGEIVMSTAKKNGIKILPVDSEHSAIWQCLAGENLRDIKKIILTASGGPFRKLDINDFKNITVEEALNHPNWDMGDKITIDSASLMNKGLEVIEAHWLFNLKPEQIDVVVHPQSIVHSMVQFQDGSIKAQMGLPDMKLPIQYALGYPNRVPSSFPRFNFHNYPNLTFQKADTKNFRNLVLAYDALRRSGNAPCALNAANEVVVSAFLENEIGFLEMSDIIEQGIQKTSFVANPTYQDYVETDIETRAHVNNLINKK